MAEHGVCAATLVLAWWRDWRVLDSTVCLDPNIVVFPHESSMRRDFPIGVRSVGCGFLM